MLNNGSILPQENNLSQQEWYSSLVSQCKEILTEAIFTSRWALVEGYWNIGKELRQNKNFDTKLLQGLAVNIGISERTLWYALQTYDKYPDINGLPEGKNISWNKLVTKYLPQSKEEIVAPRTIKSYDFNYESLSLDQVKRAGIKLVSLLDSKRNNLSIVFENTGGLWSIKGSQDTPLATKANSSCPNSKGHADCIRMIDLVQTEFGKKFINYAKQIGAIHRIIKAGFNEDQIGEAINEMDKDRFWSEKGWDLINVASYLERKTNANT